MCGILAVYSPAADIQSAHIDKALAELNHRGPDFRNRYISPDRKVALGHTLLAIADAPENSQQPIEFEHLRMTYNGEIYNVAHVRQALRSKGATLTTTSDSEALIKAAYYFGLGYLSNITGCYAFVIHDSKLNKVFFGRDPYGEKQLVWTTTPAGLLAISSESKALKHIPGVALNTNTTRIWQDFIFGFYSPRSETYFDNVHNAEPGTIYAVDHNGNVREHLKIKSTSAVCYTDENLHMALANAVKSQIPDRFSPAAILSGGLDSSIITTLLDKGSSSLQAFTAYYQGTESEDFSSAKKLTSILKHTTLQPICVSSDDGNHLFSKVTHFLEEPLLDQVYISQYLLYKAVSEKGLRVALNGQGADEFWCGYNQHYDFPMQSEAIQKHRWHDFYFKKAIESGLGLLLTESEIKTLIEEHLPDTSGKEPLEVLTQFSIENHLRAMLCHEDRLSMASSVEVRLPFLDRHVISLALSLAAKDKIVDGVEKMPLRRAFTNVLPREIAQRRKLAFPDAPEKNYTHILTSHSNQERFNGFFSQADFKKFQSQGKSLWMLFGVNAFHNSFSH
ncbi:asparagine synthase (glutamine-hydrolyzing) [Pseudomonas sp. NFACC13-1]|uniref:asparagine synthase (glutamine-hydrolyzing) n=1 Tax=Pseudomonas sp. NFACC13-1 TaxID=1566245 RepID=UPI000889E878|nr:asparagine synthase (glutamine-hydrolyzing) [Pseudomonas sp. NFACC13-1]SDB36482.1 asparagine synthase (glutamine-hydrolyzing) [Pseudomonas sp. NFACC13-1]